MKFATFTLSQITDLSRTAETLDEQFSQFILAEQLGFDSVWIAEHMFSNQAIMGSTQVLAAAIARATKRIRIGTAVNIIPYNHPLRTATDFAVVDNMSHGRLNYGCGRAYQAGEFRALGLDIDRSREMFNEGLDIILKAWAGEPLTHDGKFWKIPDPVATFPKVLQKPHPPVYAAVQTRESFVEAGRRGFNILMAALIAGRAKREAWLDDLEANIAAYEESCRAAGHDPAKLERGLMIPGHIDKDAGVARERYRPCVEWAVNASNKVKRQASADYALSMNFDTLYSLGAVITTDPAGAINQIRMLKKRLGLTEIIVEFNKGGLPHQQVEASMRMFASDVMPHVDEATMTKAERKVSA